MQLSKNSTPSLKDSITHEALLNLPLNELEPLLSIVYDAIKEKRIVVNAEIKKHVKAGDIVVIDHGIFANEKVKVIKCRPNKIDLMRNDGSQYSCDYNHIRFLSGDNRVFDKSTDKVIVEKSSNTTGGILIKLC